MPSTSAKQSKFMRAIAHSPSFAKKVGVKQSVGKDFEMADKKVKKFGGGGVTAPKPKPPENGTNGLNIPKGGYNDPYEKMPPKKKPEPPKPLGPTGKKGYASGGVAKTMPTAKGMGSMGMAKGGGIETKGKTKGKMIKMAKGGSIDGIATKGKTRCKGMS